MNPTRNDVHVDAPLTNVSIAAMNQDQSFAAQQVFTRVPVVKYSDKYFIYTSSDLFRSHTKLRAAGDPVYFRDYNVTTSTYSAENYAVGKLVPDQVVENSDNPLRPAQDATEIISHDMMMFIENNWAAESMITSVWTSETTLSGTNQWDDYANSDPIGDVDTAKFTINGLTGIPEEMLSIVMGSAVWNKLKRHPAMLAQYKDQKVITKQQAADVFGVREVIVSQAVWNTNNEGNSTQTLSRIVGKQCLVFYRPDSPSLMKAAAGYFFSKKVSEISRYYINRRKSEAVEIESTFDFKITAADAGYLVLAAVS